MSLMDRLRSSIWSNIDSIAQRIEASSGNVAGLLEQMNAEIKKARQELLRLLAEEKRLRKQAADRLQEAQQWLSRAELAVRNGSDDLARDALIQRKRITDEAHCDTRAADEHTSFARELSKDVRLMEAKYNDISARKSTLTTVIGRAQAGGGVESLGAKTKANPFDDLARVEQAIEDAELANQAHAEVEALIAPANAVPEGHAEGPDLPARRKLRIE
jgi:phage shock protein A